jgi:ATP-dependent helicase/nuclease subunit B
LVDYIRGSIELILKDFSYESVFRVLKNGLCDIDRDGTDIFENYVLALGIRGYKRYSEKFVRKYPGKTQSLKDINEVRENFVNKVSSFVDDMKKLGEDRDLDIRAMHEDIFNSMHKI